MNIIEFEGRFACTPGLGVFRGVKGAVGEHAHWTHQIAIDLEGGEVACFCEGAWVRGQGVFVPARHAHSVGEGNQLNLFFDKSIDWLDQVFGGELACNCAQVLDRDTLQGVLSCFYGNHSLMEGMQVFAHAFELDQNRAMDEMAMAHWSKVMASVQTITADADKLDSQNLYPTLGRLFSADAHA